MTCKISHNFLSNSTSVPFITTAHTAPYECTIMNTVLRIATDQSKLPIFNIVHNFPSCYIEATSTDFCLHAFMKTDLNNVDNRKIVPLVSFWIYCTYKNPDCRQSQFIWNIRRLANQFFFYIVLDIFLSRYSLSNSLIHTPI